MKYSIQTLENHSINTTLAIPGSKGITYRALILAAFADGVSEIFDIFLHEDTRILMQALHELGVSVMLDEASQSCIIGGDMGHFPRKEAKVWSGKSKTSLLFLLLGCVASPGVYHLDGTPSLQHLPLREILELINSLGAKISPPDAEKLPLTIEGVADFMGGEFEIDSVHLSQLVSAMLLVAPYAQSPMLLKTKNQQSDFFIDITCEMMGEFGVLVKRMHHARFMVPTPQRYQARDYIIEPDFICAAYFFAAAAVSAGQIKIQAVNRETAKQPEVQFLTVLEKMGCTVTSTDTHLKVKGKSPLDGVNVDIREFSHTFMALAAIAPFAKTPTTITNIKPFFGNKKNRIIHMQQILTQLNVKVESGSDWIKIFPGEIKAATVDCENDPCIGMAIAVIGLKVPGIKIENADCVTQVYPEFFNMWEKLRSRVGSIAP